MCGRVRCTLRPDDSPRACHLNRCPLRYVDMDRYRPSYNVSPGSNLPVARREDGSGGQGAVIHCMKWGLVPSFTKKSEKPNHYKMFNARSESIWEKASFRRLVPNNRCLVAVEGFYEWKKDGSKKQPYYIHFKDGRSLVFAALYDSWKNSEGDVLYTFTILTTSSSSTLKWLHDRMPVILCDKSSTDAWLLGSSSSKFDTILKPYEKPDLAWYPVTPAVGKPSFDGPECIKEIQLNTDEKKPILKFFSKKGIDDVKDLNLQVRTCEEPIKNSLEHPISASHLKKLKEDPETEDSKAHLSSTEKGADDSKPKVSTLPHVGGTNSQTKREHEEFFADTKPCTDEADRLSTSPARKKGKHGGAGDKQPTLRSYFGKT